MATPGRAARFRVQLSDSVWREEVGRYDPASAARLAAERERAKLVSAGIDLSRLQPCAKLGTDGTRLAGLVKLYIPDSDAPPSQRPFGFVFAGARDEHGPYLALVAFGDRHPTALATRSVYERAHKRLHGRYPDQ
jgi:hypothetical protein